jgi:hypothetical protein
MFAVPKDLGRNVDFVLVRHSQLSNATRSIGRVCDEELKLRGIAHPRRLPDRVPNVYRAERQFGISVAATIGVSRSRPFRAPPGPSAVSQPRPAGHR